MKMHPLCCSIIGLLALSSFSPTNGSSSHHHGAAAAPTAAAAFVLSPHRRQIQQPTSHTRAATTITSAVPSVCFAGGGRRLLPPRVSCRSSKSHLRSMQGRDNFDVVDADVLTLLGDGFVDNLREQHRELMEHDSDNSDGGEDYDDDDEEEEVVVVDYNHRFGSSSSVSAAAAELAGDLGKVEASTKLKPLLLNDDNQASAILSSHEVVVDDYFPTRRGREDQTALSSTEVVTPFDRRDGGVAASAPAAAAPAAASALATRPTAAADSAAAAISRPTQQQQQHLDLIKSAVGAGVLSVSACIAALTLSRFDEFINLVDLAGTAVFAFGGSVHAGKAGMDLLGIIMVATITAIGGGTTRDLLLGVNQPAFWMRIPAFLQTCVGTAVATFALWPALERRFGWKDSAHVICLSDAFGLAAFSVVGTQKGIDLGLSPSMWVVSALISCTFGGIIRDVLTGEKPRVMHPTKTLYATPAVLGSMAYTTLIHNYGARRQIAAAVCFVITFVARVASFNNPMRLPHWNVNDE